MYSKALKVGFFSPAAGIDQQYLMFPKPFADCRRNTISDCEHGGYFHFTNGSPFVKHTFLRIQTNIVSNPACNKTSPQYNAFAIGSILPQDFREQKLESSK